MKKLHLGIVINEEAYEKLKSLKASEKESHSDVILKHYPKKESFLKYSQK